MSMILARSPGASLCLPQQAQEVLAEDQADSGAVEAAGEEGGGEVGEAGDVLEAIQGLRDAVEVRADADVLLAGAVDEMDDVVDESGERDAGEGMRGEHFRDLAPVGLGIPQVLRLQGLPRRSSLLAAALVGTGRRR